MKLAPIADQLRDLGIRTIGGPLEWAALKAALPAAALPAAYIVPESEAGAANRLDRGVDQKVSVDFMVALVLPGAARQTGAIDELTDELAGAVRDRIAGWTHPGSSSPTAYLGARLVSADGYQLTYAVRFRTSYHFRKVAGA